MDILAWFLTIAVVGYTAALTVKTGTPLVRFYRAKNRVVPVDGKVVSFYGEDTTKIKGVIVNSFYPVYQCDVDGRTITLNGVVRREGDGIKSVDGKEVMLYDRQTGEVWCKRDLPMMERQIKVRIAVVVILLLVMIITSVKL